MATLVDFGRSTDFIFDAFFTQTQALQVVSSSATRVEIRNPETGAISIFTGSGLSARISNGQPVVGGTLTGIEVRVNDGSAPQPVATAVLTGISWSASTYVQAVVNLLESGDRSGLEALLSRQPVTYDARGAVRAVEFSFANVTSAITILGSAFDDYLEGGRGNDSLRPGIGTDFTFDQLLGSRGNDTYDLRGIDPRAFVDIGYDNLAGPVTINVNGAANTASISKGALGTDTILGVREAIDGDGLRVLGTAVADTFNLAGGSADGFVEALGGGGNDTFNLTLDGTVRVSFSFGPGTRTGQGIVMDLATGVVSQDGFGGQDRINILGGDGTLQISATEFADRILGSARNETFILRGGNDTLDGRDGYDLVRYDRSEFGTGINGNLATGVVTGNWNGQSFSHQVTNIESLRGSFQNDTLRADETGSRLDGRSGNDTITGGAGIDDLRGGDGNDVIRPGGNNDNDSVDTGAGNDQVIFDAGVDPAAFYNIFHWSLDSQAEIVVEIDTRVSTTGRIDKGGYGETTLTNLQNALAANGLRITGTSAANTFDVALQDDQQIQVVGGRGVDSYILGGTGQVIVNFQFDEYYDVEAEQGVVVNLATGAIANDGFGFAEAITFEAADTSIGIRGTKNADSITGSATHRAEFTPGGGSDTIRGGAAFETVNYWLNLTTSGVRVDLGQGSARGTYDGVAFVHQLSGIEGATGTNDFADRLIGSRGANVLDGLGGDDVIMGDGFRAAYALPQAQQVYRLYQATLDRAPDTAGQTDWTARLTEGINTLADVAASFVGSREFTNVYGALNNSQFVTLLYQNVLDRAPDAAGLTSWVGLLNTGTSRAQVVTGFSEGREFVTKTLAAANAFTNARLEANWTDDVFRLYQATLDRAPDEAGFMDWLGRLGGGTTFLSAVQGFVGSREFQNTYGALDNTAFVTLLYQNVLNRAPDAGGLANWLAQLSGGTTRAQVVEGFAQGREFVNATAGAVKDFVRGLDGGDEIRGGAGDNRLWGGILADEFVFDADDAAHHRVMDFEAWDTLNFRDFGFGEAADIRAHLRQVGADVVFQDQGVTVTLANTQLAALSDESFLFG